MKARTLIFSLRNLRKDICRCFDYEFEDVVAEVDDAEFYLPAPKHGNQLLSDLSEYLSYKTFRIPWNPAFSLPRIEGTYEIFFANMTFVHDLEIVRRMPDWRGKVGYSICYIDEFFLESLDSFSRYFPVLGRFDCVVLNCSGTLEALAERTGLKVITVPSGIDALRFCPEPDAPERIVDIVNIGRKTSAQHRQFQILQKEDQWFYLFDAAIPIKPSNHARHRENLAYWLSRSRFSVVNPAKFNVLDKCHDQEEIGFRYFEGAAAGCVMIGRIPDNPFYRDLFPWPEAVVELPEEVAGIPDFLRGLATETERLERISRDNIIGSLERHDFVYRWESILEQSGLAPLPKSLERKEDLHRAKEAWTTTHR